MRTEQEVLAMQGKRHAPSPAPRLGVGRRAEAITWVGRGRAVVARIAGTGSIDVTEYPLAADTDVRPTTLARVIEAIGDDGPVLVLGDEAERIRFEREFVALRHRPDRLVDLPTEGQVTRADLVALLRERSAR